MRKHSQVGALPVRFKKNGKVEILLVTTRGGQRWMIPKGYRPKRLDDQRAAAREALQEAGVKGKIHPRALGEFTDHNGKGDSNRITVFRLDVLKEQAHWREEHERRRRWFTPGKAKKLVRQAGLRKIIDLAVNPRSGGTR